jgi:glycosyltransferase involved in cell wall biosynthesis
MPVRVTQAKNIEYALRVVAALKAYDCKVKLIVTGPPDPHDADSMAYYESLRDLRRKLDVEAELRFVFESGLDPEAGYGIESEVVGDLFRVSDMMFMPSHREGFAMPVLEAGLVGIPVVTTEVPAAVEIGGADVVLFDKNDAPELVAARILTWAQDSKVQRLQRRVSQHFTWEAIFARDIEPLLRHRKTG